MKTAEQVLDENCDSFGIGWSERRKEQTIKAMKQYANQKLDEAAEKAKVKALWSDDAGYVKFVDRESILQLKDL